jgi:hypothetical protein
MMRITFLPLRISFTPVIESRAGMPALSGSKGGLTGSFFAGVLIFFLLRDRIQWFLVNRDTQKEPHGLNVIFVIGCTSQIVGMRLFKLFGPGC